MTTVSRENQVTPLIGDVSLSSCSIKSRRHGISNFNEIIDTLLLRGTSNKSVQLSFTIVYGVRTGS